MALIWVLYTVLNLTVFALVVLFARATHARATPNERVDLEDNSIIAEEWELVRKEHCLATGCPRVVGTPPRPRKDVTCEICAALFMERYWQERMSSAPSSEAGGGARAMRDTGAAPMARPESGLLSLDPAPRRVAPAPRRRKAIPLRIVIGRKLYAAGFCCVATGAAVGVLTNHIVPGYLLVLLGITLLLAGAATGSV